MSDKSYVAMEQHRCLACLMPFDTGSILLDTRLRETLDRHTLTGWGLCPEHRKEGFVTLIGCMPIPRAHSSVAPGDPERTGDIAMIKAEVWAEVFNVPLPEDGAAFVEADVIERLKGMTHE